MAALNQYYLRKVHMKYHENKKSSVKLNPIAASLLLLMPVVAQAEISIKNGSVTEASNGVPVVNIAKANSNGLSHNVYDTLNVGAGGVIFNNATSAAQSVLAGQIAANPNLTDGSAMVILNEVTSTNASTINGMMEVAGDSAHLIIANPNGITTQGGGFINAEKGTLTTGTPKIGDDGLLNGYSVNGGTITVSGFQSDSPTEILARSIVVNGALSASELNVVAGNNALNTEGVVTGTVTATGNASSYGVDVSKLGGMYANKINLVSTETGVGVRNQGTIAGGDSGIKLTSNGKLVNKNAAIQSSGDITLNTNGVLENSAGKINSDKMIAIDTAGNKVSNINGGNILATTNNYITSGEFDNSNGKLAAGQTLAVNTSGNTFTNTGKAKTAGIEAGVVAIESGDFNNNNGQIHAGYVGLKNTSLTNNGGTIDSTGNVEVESTGNIENVTGLIRSSAGAVKLTTTKAVKNNDNKSADTTGGESLGIVSGNGIEIAADYLFNWAGEIASDGDVNIKTTRDIDNYMGKIESSKTVSITGRDINTSQSGINGGDGVNIDLDNYYSRLGVITSVNGDVTIKANTVSTDSSVIKAKNISIDSGADIDAKYTMMVADQKLALNAAGKITSTDSDKFGFYVGQYFGYGNQQGGLIGGEGVDITAKSLNNESGRIIAQTGDVNINLTGDLASNKGQIVANSGKMTIAAKRIAADYATIYSSGNMKIDASGLSSKASGSIAKNTATGIISSDSDVLININGDYNNTGWVNAKGNMTVNASGYLTNNHAFSADGDLNLTGKTITNNSDIAAGNTLNISTANDLTNNLGANISAKTTNVTAKNISNWANLVADSELNVTASNNIYNYGNLYTNGKAVINAKKIVNTGFWAVLGGAQGFQTTANIVNIFGTVVGK
ncbi:filamentous hemagglutinin N-terminal domain-containing protein [Klebsiella aerogenes]|nr:filamentous hemagglutinin N-terminal domain-containing protein [Klebsiella aerogenes]MDT8881180.1 filamentous hemagglutinin N-terminal domain-containing protein [Klebsiella aerogenes]